MYEFHTILKQLEIPVHFIDQYIFDVIKLLSKNIFLIEKFILTWNKQTNSKRFVLPTTSAPLQTLKL